MEHLIAMRYLIAGKLEHLPSNLYVVAPHHVGSMECSPLKT